MKKPSLPTLKKKAWTIFSRIKRQFHADHRGVARCVTCNREFHWKELDAGHFVAKNRGGALWFEWSNVHPQCGYCNRYLRGNLIAYTRYMMDLYGTEEVIRLEGLAGPCKRTRTDYLELIEHLKQCEAELA